MRHNNSDFCNALITEAKRSIPRSRRNSYKPCWDADCRMQEASPDLSPCAQGTESSQAATALLSRLDEKRKEQWDEAVHSIDFSLSSLKAWSTINNLTGRSRHSNLSCPVSANATASKLVINGVFQRPRVCQARGQCRKTCVACAEPNLAQCCQHICFENISEDLFLETILELFLETTFFFPKNQ